ncbi:hypothetical protein BV25DRAFT_1964893 [Artomyces pyxidatus]|uniref:Uncharacterized protein n=1 Tax=Artomyces pyxidatus TaxID=48021 RepID=A0ACB8SRB3_9AGAM|nr:hypothetical protein BV25DRAFT_1964893 [Artomyces pyxidatus]
MYRILDLTSEEGSGGLVDKIIIAQESLQEFINTLSPGAYASLTRVDYKALDRLMIKPTGIYGSKEEIVRFLRSIGAADEMLARRLLSTRDDNSGGSGPELRSGLYIIRSSIPKATDEQVYVLYWPEDTTWNDSAVSSIRRNRATFMRYLTKICDQVVSLISADHSETLVWKDDHDDDDDDDGSMDIENDDSDRLFTFEVAKTNEQEENVTSRQGFTITSQSITKREPPRECKADPANFTPVLLRGEKVQGFFVPIFIPSEINRKRFYNQDTSKFQIKESLVLSEGLDDAGLTGLLICGLDKRFPIESAEWTNAKKAQSSKSKTNLQKEEKIVLERLERQEKQLNDDLREAVVDEVMKIFPCVSILCGSSPAGSDEIMDDDSDATSSRAKRLSTLQKIYPSVVHAFTAIINDAKLDVIKGREFRALKEKLMAAQFLLHKHKDLEPSKRRTLVDTIFAEGNMRGVPNLLSPSGRDSERKPGLFRTLLALVSNSDVPRDDAEAVVREAKEIASRTSDTAFLSSLKTVPDADLQPAISDVENEAYIQLAQAIDHQAKKLAAKVGSIQQSVCVAQVRSEIESEEEKVQADLRVEFIRKVNVSSQASTGHCVYIERLEVFKNYYSSFESYRLSGRRESPQTPEIEYRVHVLNLSADDMQASQLDPTFVATPRVNERLSHSFRLPIETTIRYAHLLENDRILLVLVEGERIAIYFERLSAIDGTIKRKKWAKQLYLDKTGADFLVTFDEAKRMLCVCASTKLQIHNFVFDENYATLQAQGSAINLVAWYNASAKIVHACFVSGSEEILLIDSGANARIFSLITMQFRPASLQFDRVPTAIYSSPDESCLITSQLEESGLRLTAYHWGTFGSTEGIQIPTPGFPIEEAVLTSLVKRSSVHLVALDVSAHRCQSVALDITRKVTEFQFKAKGGQGSSAETGPQTVHNCLIDCHGEVWTRFPVLPAVRRRTITSSSERHRKRLTFVTDDNMRPFQSYFSDMISTFERTTRKPTGQELSSIQVSATDFRTFQTDVAEDANWDVSRYRLGEWLADMLCLIPIQIAVCRENRFVPLKDGMSSAALERALLGAEVNRIVDSLSLGWYESIFQSYLANMPVRVVSSMGEQSVGKSYALNHMVDTSFAGSAMRTTEGVWMSVTPTDEALIVALDFEGVHSVERSTQEDTLLVLFNTAISNLVLFRNNFALSRDITDLFQSFQASSSVLDPAANPSLFQSTLVIIIKARELDSLRKQDVVDSDKAEVNREFSLKFQKIVQEEQDSNFISRLHAGKLNIIPWPVIESKDFYKLFPTLKRRLDQQKLTHHAAGEFLHTLKTLMAKLKANDWGALSQTMAAHRAKSLQSLLPIALETGFSEIEPEPVPLKNLDMDTVIDLPDTPARFFLTGLGIHPELRERRLSSLQQSWDQFSSRQLVPDVDWTSELSLYLNSLVDMRVEHVREWMASNLSRFQASHASVEELRRSSDSAFIDLRTNVQICKAPCTTCNLLCISSRQHEGPHDCHTNHTCSHSCSFCIEDSGEGKPCSMPAGHPGKHICTVNLHLCGEPCNLIGKQGCLEECTKVVDHAEEEHMCSAPVHMCGEPCALKGIRSPNGRTYTCPDKCRKPRQPHTEHACDSRLCPVSCQLCKRLCTRGHLHGRTASEAHLCGEEHTCTQNCSAKGACEINTLPQSIEATFTGRHETFQYTKVVVVRDERLTVSSDSKRLPCIKVIQPGDTTHAGPHIHSNEKNPFHFCEERCKSCGYLCTLPLGHAQQEHETSHGSMSSTRWAVDGPDGTTLELDGHKFSSNDEGAPMMCNIVCSSMGRHTHIDYCRAQDGAPCDGPDVQHIKTKLTPNPDRAKDNITHSLHWRRMGKLRGYPYSRDEQATFAKCDAMCSGTEHAATARSPAAPSYCTSPMFHAPANPNSTPSGLGYISNDGHTFACKNPVVLQQAFHVIFVIDRSGSMSLDDRRPLPNAPATATIRQHADNRLGAVYSALYSFWSARHAAVTQGPSGAAARRDSYSVLLFDHTIATGLVNDFASSPDQLLAAVLRYRADGGTNFTLALQHARAVMEQNWSTERTPIMIFLSDGECSVADQAVHDLGRSAVSLGKPLSFHAVSFGPDSTTSSLRRMAQIALEVQNNAPRDPLLPATATVPSSYSQALDTIRLAETFLGIAESLRKPRGSLLH